MAGAPGSRTSGLQTSTAQDSGPQAPKLQAPGPQAPDAQMPNTQAPAGNPIRIAAITVKTGRIECEVAIPDERFRRTTPRLAAFMADRYPDLPHHACVNGRGKTFGSVFEHTSTAHMLEHVIISEQARSDAEAHAPFVGTTEWIDEIAGLARVQVSFRDDLEVLRALTEALRILNIAVLTCLA